MLTSIPPITTLKPTWIPNGRRSSGSTHPPRSRSHRAGVAMCRADADGGKARRELPVGAFTPSELAVGRWLERHRQFLHRDRSLRLIAAQAGGLASPP